MHQFSLRSLTSRVFQLQRGVARFTIPARIARLALLSAVPLALLQAGMAQAQTSATPALRLINEYPATSVTAAADLKFAEEVRSLSAGSLAVTTLQESANTFKGKDQVAAVSERRVEMGTLFAGILGTSDPFFLLSSLPFVVKDFAQAEALFKCARPELEQHLASLNLHLLYVTPWPPSGIWSAQPVTDLASLRALRIRTYDDNSRGSFARLGAFSVNLPFSAVGPRLASGDLNAVLSSGDGGAGNKLWEHLPNFTAVNYAIPLSYTLINNDAWKALSPQQQGILSQAAARIDANGWKTVKDRIEVNYARMREHGMRLNLAPAESVTRGLRQAGNAQTDSWWQQNDGAGIRARCLK
ncbi:TRAP transporter substrate-binding protein [Herbaspirillum lusitanum]|uniref:TRAP transporter substrate-binding protein n=1 Tax=Herbaspirillum lusitanum TaxID=213312 RepID=A0ABW9A3P3_9BURK